MSLSSKEALGSLVSHLASHYINTERRSVCFSFLFYKGSSKILSSVGAVSWSVRESIAKEQLGLDATALVHRRASGT